MNDKINEYVEDTNPEFTDMAVGILAITGAITIAGLVTFGIGKIAYKISESITNKIGDKILGSTEEEA